MLDPAIEAKLKDMKGIDLEKLEVGTRIEAKTKNSLYKIFTMGHGKFQVVGGEYFPEKGLHITRIRGSTFGGSIIKIHWLGIGMHIEFPECTTTAVQSLKIIGPNGDWEYEI